MSRRWRRWCPTVIDANRAQRMSLVSTNCLGQTGPAIADTDADYEQMWAQDADALYAYAVAAANASAVTQFTPPPATIRGTGWPRCVPAPRRRGAPTLTARRR